MTEIEKLRSSLEAYLSGAISSSRIVNAIDDMVSSDAVYDLPQSDQDIILKYQDIVAYYVEDELKRSESPSFFGPEELQLVIGSFLGDLKAKDW